MDLQILNINIREKYKIEKKDTQEVLGKIKDYWETLSEEFKGMVNKIPELKYSKNKSGRTLPIVPWYSFEIGTFFTPTVLFNIGDKKTFLSLQQKTDNKKLSELISFTEIYTNILEKTHLKKKHPEFKIGSDKTLLIKNNISSMRPKKYGRCSILNVDITTLNHDEIMNHIIKFINIALELDGQETSETLTIADEVSAIEKHVLAKIRVGQQEWRRKLMKKYGNICAICSVSDSDQLIASHISRWSVDKANRGSLDNGLVLCREHDGLFDKYKISFDNYGSIIISNNLKVQNYRLTNEMKLRESYIKNYDKINLHLHKHRKEMNERHE